MKGPETCLAQGRVALWAEAKPYRCSLARGIRVAWLHMRPLPVCLSVCGNAQPREVPTRAVSRSLSLSLSRPTAYHKHGTGAPTGGSDRKR
jgi:hypothetical protein